MTEQQLEEVIYHGFNIRLSFLYEKPTFGDLFMIRGFDHPLFPPTDRFNFAALENLGFDQVDDYFGIPNHEEDGGDVKVWLSPLVNDQSVYHHHGPFDGLELSYCARRNPPHNTRLFLEVISEFAQRLPVDVLYTLRNQDLGNPPNLASVRKDIEHVIAYWRAQDIEPGSSAAMRLTF
ncbi:hypothetical protein EON83_03545 [bacterium]|nr:MAG: hypothetical protein EON83_03545 [bacterium]